MANALIFLAIADMSYFSMCSFVYLRDTSVIDQRERNFSFVSRCRNYIIEMVVKLPQSTVVNNLVHFPGSGLLLTEKKRFL